ncbi:MAG: SusC/RagA family TonB-linked outer membrane protein [Bacteroidota bacterium]
MKKLSLVVMLLFAVFSMAMAQQTLSGKITDQGGEPLIGASILVKGTTKGTTTDFDGMYTLELAEGENELVVSYTGFNTMNIEVNGRTSIDISMEEGITLTQAVVTGLGIEREQKSLGYAVQEVQGEAVTAVADQNVVSALTGKVAGVQVISASGASVGGSAKIRIRGANSLTGGSPLFVIDGTPISNANFSAGYRGVDYGNLASDINPEDIENISVLKGPTAAAIYGNRGANGVILITTKKGKKRKGIGVTYTGTVTADRVYILPEYQNEYGGGYTQDFLRAVDPVDGQEYNVLNYAADESWGPRMDGTMYRPWWSWFPGEDYGQQIPMEAQPNNVRDYFDTGVTFNNNISMSGGNDQTTFRLSYTNINQTGVIPNSSINRNNVSINASSKLTEKLTFGANINFVDIQGEGRPTFGYNGNNPVNSFNQWFQRQLDIDRLRDYRNPDGTFKSWNIRSPTNLRPLYWDSPFFVVYENFPTDSRNRYYGNLSLTYEVNENLTIAGFVRRDDYTFRNETRTATGGLSLDDYNEFVANSREDNYEFLASYAKSFGDITIDANLGGNIRLNDYHSNSLGVVGGLTSPNLFNIKASTDRPSVAGFISEKNVRSIYGGANFGYKSFLYLGFTVRNDWSSALPVDNNSYLYPSFTGSFVFSELMNSSLLSFGKIRASYAQVGSDIGPYQTNFTYGAGTPYGNLGTFSLPNTLINEDLRPALSSSYEFGVELRFLNDRLGIDATYYNNDAQDQILTLAVPGSSGFSSAIINAGLIRSNGFELALNATPVQTSKLNWDVFFNIATNNSEVIELADGLDNRRLDGWGWGGLSINAPVGGEWGEFTGRGFTYDEATGLPLINEDGSFVRTNNKSLGGFLPDWTGGFRNVIDWNGFSLSAFIEFQIGGQFHSVTRMFNAYSGLGEETVGLNDKGNPVRDAVADGGGVRVDGILPDGSQGAVYVDAQTHYSSHLFAMNENWLYDASYVKFRELSLGYSFPSKMLSKTPIQSLKLSLIARNLWLISSEVDGIDPSEISPGSNGFVFQENGQLPGVRSLGINLRVGF